MKEISVVEPLFFTEFSCIGSSCRDHCCKGWSITLDKPTVNRYLTSGVIEIRNIAQANIVKTKTSYGNWGKMKLHSDGHCAFMDEERLCKIHKELGEKALSPTCATYPRMQKHFKHEIRQNLTLSCPEATRILLSNADAMLVDEKTVLRAQGLNAIDPNQESRLVNLMCANIMLASGVNTEQGFYGIVLLFLYIDKLPNSEDRIEKLEQYFSDIVDAVQRGKIKETLYALKPDHKIQSALLIQLQGYLATKQGVRGWQTLQHYIAKLIYLQGEGLEKGDTGQTLQHLGRVWDEQVMPWMRSRPHIMGNYIQYRMYNDFFPGNKNIPLLSNLYLLVSEWFLLKSLIAACVDLVGSIEEEDIINIIYSFHAVTKHDQVSDKAFLDEIEKSKVNDDLSLIYLLT